MDSGLDLGLLALFRRGVSKCVWGSAPRDRWQGSERARPPPPVSSLLWAGMAAASPLAALPTSATSLAVGIDATSIDATGVGAASLLAAVVAEATGFSGRGGAGAAACLRCSGSDSAGRQGSRSVLQGHEEGCQQFAGG